MESGAAPMTRTARRVLQNRDFFMLKPIVDKRKTQEENCTAYGDSGIDRDALKSG
jgi:hypothetical protein